MFFGGLFMAYIVYRVWYPEAFAAGQPPSSTSAGAASTPRVLIGSSLTMALAVRAAQTGKRKAQVVNWLLLTMVLGASSSASRCIEYADKFEHHHRARAAHFDSVDAARTPSRQLRDQFFSLYFAMTGLHALHMIIGIGLMAVITWMALEAASSTPSTTRRSR